MERFAAMDEREKVGGGAVLLLTGVLIIALVTFAGVQAQSLRIVLGIVGVIAIVFGVLSIGTSQKTV
jgi:hypothetical protein